MDGPHLDFIPVLRQTLIEIRSLGLTEAAEELERRVFSASTTSSEWLGESGRGITAFLEDHRSRLPESVVSSLERCLREIGRVWPKYLP